MKSIIQPFKGRICVIFSLFLSCFVVSSSQLRAQTIPDASFAEAIRVVCPTCIDASNKLLPPAAALTSLDVSAKGIADLTGIEGFAALKMLNCQNNRLTQLPSLPGSLTSLLCDVNQITTLPALPAGLNALSCNYNQLAFLPVLPNQLQAITCNNNQLVQLPALPKTLMALSCTNNLLTALPELPEKLQLLFCTANKITQLPALPDGLTTVYCHDNPISCLPYLPNSLSVLYIDTEKVGCLPNTVPGLKVYNLRGNLVDNLPVCVFIQDPKFAEAIRNNCPSCIGSCNNLTPNAAIRTSLDISSKGILSLSGIENFTSLQILNCNSNVLTTLPSNLPKTLTFLDCSRNPITALPSLPNQLIGLTCNYCNLSSIDSLPSNLIQLYCNNNFLTTLQKLPASLFGLSCQNNKLLSLPELPAELTQLSVGNNQLTSLPTLPSKLLSIEVNNNHLTNLPTLPPKLNSLYCSNNALKCLPVLPNSLTYLAIDNNEITCLPNQVSGLNVFNNGRNPLPLCGVADLEFRKAIQSNCPSCLDDCFKIVATETAKVTSLNLNGKNIANLTGIELFTTLQSLNIAGNPLLTCLPALPKSVTSLTIDTDKISCLSNSNPDLKVYNAAGQLIQTPPTCVGYIPDANFAKAIRSYCPTCIDMCDNLLPPAATLQNLQIYADNIGDLTGIEQFKNLKTFTCYISPLTNLPVLPPALEHLIWINGKLKVVSNLPNTIVTFDCSNNKIEQIEALPSSLQNLNISSNQLQTLPTLPSPFTYLNFSNNKVSTVPELPNTITYLNFSYNKVNSILRLPENLLELICDNNELTSLPALPSKVSRITCTNNKLSKLPELPNRLFYINCSDNPSLTCLPILPRNLQHLYIYNDNNISCLPNSTPTLYVYENFVGSLPLCGFADGNLAQAIKEACPPCLDECFKLIPAEAEKVTSLDLSGKNINSLVGLEAFSALQSLNISNNALVCIPSLPKTLTSLTIDADKITCLPIQNPNLKVYDAAGQLIPTPAVCKGFVPDANFARAIRNSCPTCIDDCNNLLPPAQALSSLSLGGYNITDLTGIEGFTNLQTLNCNSNKLSQLPELPKKLTWLDCSSNLLTSLSSLPATLLTLYCSNNSLTELPPLPNSLQGLFCENNNLKKLPPLPSKLISLYCSQNVSLICLPILPQTLQSLSIYGNSNIKCLPNSVKGLSVYSNSSVTLPVCSVPDANFLQAIQEACPTCLDECLKFVPAEVAKITSINLAGKNIGNLTGLEVLSGLESLNISNNSLVCIPYLPQTVTLLTIDADKITCLPAHHPNLKVFNAAGQPITTPVNCTGFIPDVNFAKAIRNSCYNCIDDCNNLLPPAKDLQHLYSSRYNISDLTGIEGFTNLQTLNCNNNNLSVLPNLPTKLTSLNCSNNQLKQLPVLPETLRVLDCSNNQLSQLPPLPAIVQELYCANNQLNQLPQLPEVLQRLYCHKNQITCLSNLPISLTYFQFDSDRIGCLPNIRTNVTIVNQNSQQLSNYTECSNPIILSDITASSPNPLISGGNVTFTIKRNYTGTVSIKWQRKKANESDFSDFTPAATLYGVNSDLTYTLSQLALTDNGNSYRAVVISSCLGTFFSKAITIEVNDLSVVTPVITSSPRDTVCVGQTVQLSTSCAAGASVEWSTGATSASIAVTSIQPASRSYTAKCVLGSNKTDSSPAKVIVWKPLEVTLINIGQSQSGVKPGVSVPMSAWNNQFVTPDAGPDLHTSTQANPTIYYIENSNKTTPRYWTAHVDACDLPATGSISYDMLATPEVGAPMSFNTHENSAPYLMYANRDGFTELYAQNNVFFGFYEKDNTGQNRYDAGLPKGLYKLSIRYWNQKGNGLAPAVRATQGSQLSYQEHWFRIQSQAGVGSGTARIAVDLSSRRFAEARDLNPLPFAAIAPNPASKYVVLSLQNAKQQEVYYELVDVSGRVRFQGKVIPETNAHAEYIDLSNQTTGMYLMRVNSPTKQAVLKVIKTE